ncbi:MAG: ATP-dependent DNA helicase RecG [Acidimicrobiia bacterium]|nr:ATP-dependent DNA helicase RecG [Acidimicrobiia bacterium]
MTGRSLAYLANVDVDNVKGIGPKAFQKLRGAGIESVADLLLHAPRRYLDRSELFDLASVPLGEEVTVAGVVTETSKRRISGRRTMVEAVVKDGTNVLRCVWFNPYIKIAVGEELAFSGKVVRRMGRLEMKSPDIDRLDSDSLITARIVPVHPSVGGLRPHQMRQSIHNALVRARPVAEILPEELLDRLDLMDRDTAISSVHFPEAMSEARAARHRLVFDELFRLEIALAMRKQRQIDDSEGIAHPMHGDLLDSFVASLPYELTGAQVRAIDEIRTDLARPHPMHRLLQGEVGSGKTVVAVGALLSVVQGGYQGAVMAPTEVLAVQHYLGTVDLLQQAGLASESGEFASDSLFGDITSKSGGSVVVALVTSNQVALSSEPDATRTDVLAAIASGDVDVTIGTHSLIQEGISFSNLGLAVVDEQHRFGVYQRVQLKEKGTDGEPDLLIMTATPIPRTLSMTLYGDLDVTVLDEMPPGRTPVRTITVSNDAAAIKPVYDLVRNEVAAGRQAFVVCPLVEDSDKLEATSATTEYERLVRVFPEMTVGLLHGQMRPADKDAVMHQFRDGAIDVLVATTVIEVGIDIPNATVMIIEDADRFGLSQLHQLRGRVGRGRFSATCVLIADPTTEDGEARIAAMVATTDGFRLAEEDLRIRGQGTVFGVRQAGVKDLKLADIVRDAQVLFQARKEAFALVATDPRLVEHPAISAEIQALMGDDVEWLFRS